jgi:hypothetical protein
MIWAKGKSLCGRENNLLPNTLVYIHSRGDINRTLSKFREQRGEE